MTHEFVRAVEYVKSINEPIRRKFFKYNFLLASFLFEIGDMKSICDWIYWNLFRIPKPESVFLTFPNLTLLFSFLIFFDCFIVGIKYSHCVRLYFEWIKMFLSCSCIFLSFKLNKTVHLLCKIENQLNISKVTE